MKRLVITLLIIGGSLLTACDQQSARSEGNTAGLASPPNIILMIGDGMGNAVTSAYRYYATEQHGRAGGLDEILTGSVSTRPDDTTLVTDSAASATAYATGQKTKNRMLSMSPSGSKLTTLMELARQQGYATGVVTTVPVTHATPAAFYAHVDDRGNYTAIADQFVDNRSTGTIPIDLALGGGLEHFQRSDRDLLAELNTLGYQVADSYQQLNSLTRLPAIGLFAATGMPHAIDEPVLRKYRLRDMTSKALALLSAASRPFVVMIEGGQIDWCGHVNDIACMMAEMADFEEAVAQAKAFVKTHPNTLLVVTADHNTGGLSLGGQDAKIWKPDVIAGVTRSVELLANRIQYSPLHTLDEVWEQGVGFALQADERKQLLSVLNADPMDDISSPLQAVVRGIINRRSYTGWTTLSHTADDVPLYALGSYAGQFSGKMDNAEIGRELARLLRYHR